MGNSADARHPDATRLRGAATERVLIISGQFSPDAVVKMLQKPNDEPELTTRTAVWISLVLLLACSLLFAAIAFLVSA